MGIAQDIVIVNEYTVPALGGSRGTTPGDYTLRYMARDGAVETVTPVRRNDAENFITHYMARSGAVDQAIRPSEATRKAEQVTGSGGVAFGYGDVSLSHDSLMAAAADIQRLYDEGHTVMKTVISFDTDYLRKSGVIPADFIPKERGDFRGKVDQLRLRMAIMRGLERMGHKFDDLRYVGVIQVDTLQVHCHLSIVDAGKGRRIMYEGKDQQKGKLEAKDISMLRRGIDSWLDTNQRVPFLASSTAYERRNVVSHVKRWAHESALGESLPQLLLACLPEDKNLWRYGTNNASMKRANALARELVEDVLADENSPMASAMLSVELYAAHRAKREKLSKVAEENLIKVGRERIIERCVNGVYQVMASLPEEAVNVRTPLLTVMSQDVDELVSMSKKRFSDSEEEKDDDIIGFTMRLRSYSMRLREHNELRREYQSKLDDWKHARQIGAASGDSKVMRDFFEYEEEYHRKCVSKYRHLLGGLVQSEDDGSYSTALDEVNEYRRILVGLTALQKDRSIGRMKDADAAEEMGVKTYGVSGGRLMATGGKGALDDRINRVKARLDDAVMTLRSHLAGEGMVITSVDGDDIAVGHGSEWSFADVKAIDLHNVRYDTIVDMAMSRESAESFIDAAKVRNEHIQAALDYLTSTGQGEIAQQTLPLSDARSMVRTANMIKKDLESKGDDLVLTSALADMADVKEKIRRSATVSLDHGLSQVVVHRTQQVAQHLSQIGEEDLANMLELE